MTDAPDIHNLTGAYALDAMVAADRYAFEDHVVRCPTCTYEVREFREVAAHLAVAVARAPAAAVRERMLAGIEPSPKCPRRSTWLAIFRSLVGRRELWPLIGAVSVMAVLAFAGVAERSRPQRSRNPIGHEGART